MQVVCPQTEISQLFDAAKMAGKKIGSKKGYDVYRLNVRIDSGSAKAKPFIVSYKDGAPYKIICKYFNQPTEIFDIENGTLTQISKNGDMFSRRTFNAETGELLDSFNLRKDFGALFTTPAEKNTDCVQNFAKKVNLNM